MSKAVPEQQRQDRWRVSRRFEGDRDPEALVRALLEAHRR